MINAEAQDIPKISHQSCCLITLSPLKLNGLTQTWQHLHAADTLMRITVSICLFSDVWCASAARGFQIPFLWKIVLKAVIMSHYLISLFERKAFPLCYSDQNGTKTLKINTFCKVYMHACAQHNMLPHQHQPSVETTDFPHCTVHQMLLLSQFR